MSDFLSQIALRVQEPQSTVQPRPTPLFEPPRPPVFDPGEFEEATETRSAAPDQRRTAHLTGPVPTPEETASPTVDRASKRRPEPEVSKPTAPSENRGLGRLTGRSIADTDPPPAPPDAPRGAAKATARPELAVMDPPRRPPRAESEAPPTLGGVKRPQTDSPARIQAHAGPTIAPRPAAPVTPAKTVPVKTTPAAASAPTAAPRNEPPTIQVTIGRVEIRAVPVPVQAAKPTAAARAMSLEDYLKQRSGERR